MTEKKTLSGKALAWILTAVYFASYVTRINFSAIIQEIVTDTGFEKTSLSIILVCLSITYGAGQIINGRLGDIIKPQKLILIGISAATLINFILPLFSSSVVMMAILWAINGFAQAMMWPPMVKILVATADDAMYSYSVIRISWGSSFGTILVYLTAPLLIGLFGWKGVFVCSALVGLAIGIVWFFAQRRISLPDDLDLSSNGEKKKLVIPKITIFPLIFIALGIIFQGMLRDGVTSWMPTYLAEVFKFDNKVSILCTLSLAVFSIICFSVAGGVYRKFFKSEVTCAGLIFAVAAVSALFLFIFFESHAIVAIFLMAMITGCMHGVNLMLISIVPKRFKKYGNISTISGLVNACTYIGAAISTYAIALLSERIGWRNTVGVWFVIAIVGTASCIVALKPWNKFIEK